jgi:hypothetical protein
MPQPLRSPGFALAASRNMYAPRLRVALSPMIRSRRFPANRRSRIPQDVSDPVADGVRRFGVRLVKGQLEHHEVPSLMRWVEREFLTSPKTSILPPISQSLVV